MSHLERFSDRAEAYSSYRPSYPKAILDQLSHYGLTSKSVVADIGSGTGILSKLLLERGAEVFAIEPNQSMRNEAERLLGSVPGFHSVNATAQATGLPGQSIDLITAAQSFHWFDLLPTKAEWKRIAKPNAWVALIWNERIEDNAFSRGFGQIARAFVDKQGAATFRRLADPTAEIASFFDPNLVHSYEFANHQLLTLEGVKGRALSSSYWPTSGAEYVASLQRLEELFAAHQVEGLVRMDYQTEMFLGQVA